MRNKLALIVTTAIACDCEAKSRNRVLEFDGKGSHVELPASTFTNQTLVTIEG